MVLYQACRSVYFSPQGLVSPLPCTSSSAYPILVCVFASNTFSHRSDLAAAGSSRASSSARGNGRSRLGLALYRLRQWQLDGLIIKLIQTNKTFAKRVDFMHAVESWIEDECGEKSYCTCFRSTDYSEDPEKYLKVNVRNLRQLE